MYVNLFPQFLKRWSNDNNIDLMRIMQRRIFPKPRAVDEKLDKMPTPSLEAGFYSARKIKKSHEWNIYFRNESIGEYFVQDFRDHPTISAMKVQNILYILARQSHKMAHLGDFTKQKTVFFIKNKLNETDDTIIEFYNQENGDYRSLNGTCYLRKGTLENSSIS